MPAFSRFVGPILFALVLTVSVSFSEAAKRPAGNKKVFKNEDLEAAGQRYSPTEKPSPGSNSKEDSVEFTETDVKSQSEPKASEELKSGLAKHKAELTKVDKELKEVKDQEVKYQGVLAKYEDSFTNAQTDFQKQTLEWQIEDMQTHLARLSEKRKAIEARKEGILREAAEQEEVKSPSQ